MSKSVPAHFLVSFFGMGWVCVWGGGGKGAMGTSIIIACYLHACTWQSTHNVY